MLTGVTPVMDGGGGEFRDTLLRQDEVISIRR